jgi:hypothetical protein
VTVVCECAVSLSLPLSFSSSLFLFLSSSLFISLNHFTFSLIRLGLLRSEARRARAGAETARAELAASRAEVARLQADALETEDARAEERRRAEASRAGEGDAVSTAQAPARDGTAGSAEGRNSPGAARGVGADGSAGHDKAWAVARAVAAERERHVMEQRLRAAEAAAEEAAVAAADAREEASALREEGARCAAELAARVGGAGVGKEEKDQGVEVAVRLAQEAASKEARALRGELEVAPALRLKRFFTLLHHPLQGMSLLRCLKRDIFERNRMFPCDRVAPRDRA